jgi:hypothetical protein
MTLDDCVSTVGRVEFPDCPCREQGCTIHRWYDVRNLREVFRHGDNEEALLFVDDETVVRMEHPEGVFAEWSHRIHEWLDRGVDTWA